MDQPPTRQFGSESQTSAGRTLYKLRKPTVAPVFGIIKSGLGFRQFLLRGREKVSLEGRRVGVSYSFKRVFTLKNLAPVR